MVEKMLWHLLRSVALRGSVGQQTIHPQDRPYEPDVSKRHIDWEGIAMETLSTT